MPVTGQGPVVGGDGLARCPWGAASEVYRAYHDTEWGVPVQGEAAYLERLTLEAFQSGLSWLTILNKREAFREVFAGFDAAGVNQWSARYGNAESQRTPDMALDAMGRVYLFSGVQTSISFAPFGTVSCAACTGRDGVHFLARLALP